MARFKLPNRREVGDAFISVSQFVVGGAIVTPILLATPFVGDMVARLSTTVSNIPFIGAVYSVTTVLGGVIGFLLIEVLLDGFNIKLRKK